jgi:hypothetical protein
MPMCPAAGCLAGGHAIRQQMNGARITAAVERSQTFDVYFQSLAQRERFVS